MKSLTLLRRQLTHNLPIFFGLMLFELCKPWLMLKYFWAIHVNKQDSLEYRVRQMTWIAEPRLHDKLFFATVDFVGYLKRHSAVNAELAKELHALMHPAFLACYAMDDWRLNWIDILHGILRNGSAESRIYFEAMCTVSGLTRHRLQHLIGEQAFTQLEKTPLEELHATMKTLLSDPSAPQALHVLQAAVIPT